MQWFRTLFLYASIHHLILMQTLRLLRYCLWLLYCLVSFVLLRLHASTLVRLYDYLCFCHFTLHFLYSSTALHLYTSTSLRLYAYTPLRHYASTSTRLYVSMPLCLYACKILHRFTLILLYTSLLYASASEHFKIIHTLLVLKRTCENLMTKSKVKTSNLG